MDKNNSELLTLFSAPEESPGYLLWHVSLAWKNTIEDTLKKFDLTHPQFVVLATTAWLTKHNKHVSQIDIGKASGLDPNTTSQILRGLEAKNLIKRTRELNERSKNPLLTELGFTVLNNALPAVEKRDLEFFEILSPEEMVAFVKLFQKFKKSLA